MASSQNTVTSLPDVPSWFREELLVQLRLCDRRGRSRTRGVDDHSPVFQLIGIVLGRFCCKTLQAKLHRWRCRSPGGQRETWRLNATNARKLICISQESTTSGQLGIHAKWIFGQREEIDPAGQESLINNGDNATWWRGNQKESVPLVDW